MKGRRAAGLRTSKAVVVAVLAASSAAAVAQGSAAASPPSPDFNGDGKADAAVGAPSDSLVAPRGGTVSVLFGSGAMTLDNATAINQDSPGVPDEPEAGEQFGQVLATGNLNGDRYDDLIVGNPLETAGLSEQPESGAITAIYGSKRGFRTRKTEEAFQGLGRAQGAPEAFDRFGNAVTVADFNADGFDDVAVSATEEEVDTVEAAGEVQILPGSAHGLLIRRGTVLHAGKPLSGPDLTDTELFGSVLSAGDFNGDGRDDLAISSPIDFRDRGGVWVVPGSRHRILSPRRARFVDQSSPWLEAAPPADQDDFGALLDSSDFDRDGNDDLVVSAPDTDGPGRGRVFVIRGGRGLLSRKGSQQLDEPDLGATYFGWGSSMTVGEFDGNRHLDLAVGASFGPGMNHCFGAVMAFFGAGKLKELGLRRNLLTELDPRVALGTQPQDCDRFGSALSAADVNGRGSDELLIGESQAGDEDHPATGPGYLYVFAAVDDNFPGEHKVLTQGAEGGGAVVGDQFGAALASSSP